MATTSNYAGIAWALRSAAMSGEEKKQEQSAQQVTAEDKQAAADSASFTTLWTKKNGGNLAPAYQRWSADEQNNYRDKLSGIDRRVSNFIDSVQDMLSKIAQQQSRTAPVPQGEANEASKASIEAAIRVASQRLTESKEKLGAIQHTDAITHPADAADYSSSFKP